MPAVNGHVVSLPALHASSSISSLAPATMTFGAWASTARAGSFCLFCENGPDGLPLLTRVSPPAATAVADASAITAPTTTIENVGPRLRICSPFCYRSAMQQMLGLYPSTARPALGVAIHDTADSWVAQKRSETSAEGGAVATRTSTRSTATTSGTPATAASDGKHPVTVLAGPYGHPFHP